MHIKQTSYVRMDDANTCKSHKRSLRCVGVAEEKTQLNIGTYYTAMLM